MINYLKLERELKKISSEKKPHVFIAEIYIIALSNFGHEKGWDTIIRNKELNSFWIEQARKVGYKVHRKNIPKSKQLCNSLDLLIGFALWCRSNMINSNMGLFRNAYDAFRQKDIDKVIEFLNPVIEDKILKIIHNHKNYIEKFINSEHFNFDDFISGKIKNPIYDLYCKIKDKYINLNILYIGVLQQGVYYGSFKCAVECQLQMKNELYSLFGDYMNNINKIIYLFERMRKNVDIIVEKYVAAGYLLKHSFHQAKSDFYIAINNKFDGGLMRLSIFSKSEREKALDALKCYVKTKGVCASLLHNAFIDRELHEYFPQAAIDLRNNALPFN